MTMCVRRWCLFSPIWMEFLCSMDMLCKFFSTFKVTLWTVFTLKLTHSLFRLNNCTSMGRGGTIQPGSADLFAFTCTNAVLFHIARNDDEAKLVAEHLRKIAGAAVFNLKGEVVGILSSYARGYDVKLAKKSSYFKKHFDKLGDKQVK
uniref:Uncharacterized protein n=1 Tax=Aegilops tauschii subsp. strangulata TaxID=200361 RepID=A0A453LK42_AEGTS